MMRTHVSAEVIYILRISVVSLCVTMKIWGVGSFIKISCNVCIVKSLAAHNELRLNIIKCRLIYAEVVLLFYVIN